MLKRIRLIDFKSFVDEAVEVAPLTLLVGANASGKSNFLDAIRFLKGITFDLTLSEVLNGETRSEPDAWPGIRGRAEESARLGAQKEFTIDSTWLIATAPVHPDIEAARSEVDRIDIRHYIACRISTSHVELEEELFESKLLRGAAITGGTRSLMGARRDLQAPDDRIVSRLGNALRNIQSLNINPSEMRDYGRRGEPLGSEGRNVSGVLAKLCEDPEEKQALVRWVAELCVPEIEGLDFLEVKQLGDVMAMFVEKGGHHISARSISDGTLHLLGTILSLYTAAPGSVILIEEIESKLHPTRIHLLVDYLETVTRERQIQVIATTHSPVVLQWLSYEALRNTIVFGRVAEQAGTIMRRLGDLPHFQEVVQRKGIEELFTLGWLEMAL